MTMDDEMDRDLEQTRPSGEPAGVHATYPDDSQPTDEQRRPEETRSTAQEAEPTPEPGGEPMPAQDQLTRPQNGGRAPGSVTEDFDLLGDGELTSIRDRWEGVQATFVDDPAGAARQADTMVGEVLDHLQRRHRQLHDEAGRPTNGDADTEALRVQFLRYRSFIRTLLG
jgi:hypothetical protein